MSRLLWLYGWLYSLTLYQDRLLLWFESLRPEHGVLTKLFLLAQAFTSYFEFILFLCSFHESFCLCYEPLITDQVIGYRLVQVYLKVSREYPVPSEDLPGSFKVLVGLAIEGVIFHELGAKALLPLLESMQLPDTLAVLFGVWLGLQVVRQSKHLVLEEVHGDPASEHLPIVLRLLAVFVVRGPCPALGPRGVDRLARNRLLLGLVLPLG